MSPNLRVALLAAVFLLLHGLTQSAVADRKSHATMVEDVIDNHIVPRIGRLDEATHRLTAALEAYCKKPAGDSSKGPVARRFEEAVVAWAEVDFLRFGPAAKESRLERFFFWPDPRATTSRQLAAILARRDPALLEKGALRKQSVAVQGLGALELIIYDSKHPLTGTDESAAYRCAYAHAVAINLSDIADELVNDWASADGWRMRMLAPGSDNPVYKDASETGREIVKAIMTGLQIIQDRHVVPRLEALLATHPKRARLPFQKSGLTGKYLSAGLASISAMFDESGLAGYIPPDKLWMRKFVPRSFRALIADGKRIPSGEKDLTLSDRQIQHLRKMRFDVNGLRQIIGRQIAPAAELPLGFNELDGD